MDKLIYIVSKTLKDNCENNCLVCPVFNICEEYIKDGYPRCLTIEEVQSQIKNNIKEMFKNE